MRTCSSFDAFRLSTRSAIGMFAAVLVIVASCGRCCVFADEPVQSKPAFFHPTAYADVDYNDPNARFSWARSKESEHFYLFWEPGFGKDTNAETVPENLRVDSDDMLEKAERFYKTNVENLHMINKLPNGYKIQIYLMYQEDWLATGAGFDEQIGALWISPATCRPVGSTIAHEIGHAFQYLVSCQLIAANAAKFGEAGFRYAYPEGRGNAFWEICAQWQAWQDYPEEMFVWFEMDVWFANYRRAFENELTRYQNYWPLYYFAEKRGLDVLSRIWNESRFPEDAMSTYMRLYLNNDLDAFYDDMYEYASKVVTFDFDACRQYSEPQQGRYDSTLYEMSDGYRQIAYGSCPEVNGFAAIKLEPKAGQKVCVDFKGMRPGDPLAEEDPGEYLIDEQEKKTTSAYNEYDGTIGWRYGFVALLDDGTRVYSPDCAESESSVSFDVPENVRTLYFVVLGTAKEYVCHVWDGNELNDVQTPFAVRVHYEK